VKPATVRLVLIRHGEVDANREFRYLGRRDDPLNRLGLRQAEALASSLAELHLDFVLSSPLARARATAETILRDRDTPWATDERLIELDFGSWEGRSRDQVVNHSPVDRRAVIAWERDPSLPTPGGESLASLQKRVVDLADELAGERDGETVALVSHMGPIKTLLCAALDLSLTGAGRIFLDPGTVSVVDWGSRAVVRLVNSHGHLGFANARWVDKS
jgi:broad specificity phosphatase PhoE